MDRKRGLVDYACDEYIQQDEEFQFHLRRPVKWTGVPNSNATVMQD